MKSYLLHLDKLPDLLAAWALEMELQVPVKTRDGVFEFRKWDRVTPIAWDYDLAYTSLKRFVAPPEEDLVRFDMPLDRADPVFDDSRRILLGVHPYDLRAFHQLDRAMLGGIEDPHYRARREGTIIFSLTPQAVHPASFWANIGPSEIPPADLHWTRLDEETFHVAVGSERGLEQLLLEGELPEAGPEHDAAATAEQERIWKFAASRQRKLLYPWRQTPELLEDAWNHPLWRKNAEHCLACGSCVMVCPTCFCFDMRDEPSISLQTGRRYRVWDGCLLPSFAKVAGGGSFRPKARQRYRHRFFRKGRYMVDLIDELACVGCGRCGMACPTAIADPLTVFNALWEDLP